MKKTKILFIIGFALLMIANPVLSQQASDAKEFKFTIKTNPLSALGGPFWVIIVPVTGEYKVLFEAAVSDKSSFQLGLGYLGPSALINLDDISSDPGSVSGINTNGFRVQGMYKIFVSRDLSAPEGFYLGPHLSYAQAKIENKSDASAYLSGKKFNVNGVIGYQMITAGGFTLDLYTGMGLVSRKWNVSGQDFDIEEFKDKTTISIPFSITFGYAF